MIFLKELNQIFYSKNFKYLFVLNKNLFFLACINIIMLSLGCCWFLGE